jgi:hypothetical protein
MFVINNDVIKKHVERKVPKYGLHRNRKRKRKLLPKKKKRSPDERYTQTHGNLPETVRRSQMPFSIIRNYIYMSAWSLPCVHILLSSDRERHL